MPELPEVETVCRGLSQAILGKKITGAVNRRPNLRIPFPSDFSSRLQGRTVTAIKRRAKYILITLDDNTVIIAHLGMSGQMVVYGNLQNERKKHDHAVFQFDDGKEVVFNDPRRFGLITFSNTNELNDHKLIAGLGVEPLEDIFDGEMMNKLLSKKSTPIKNAVMDARIIVGVGNIYACEALFKSGISPLRKCCDIEQKAYYQLALNIKDILNEAIKSGGSTLRDYVQSSGESGYFQHKFNVYGKEGEACTVCYNAIQRIKQSGRSTFYCGNCQI